MIDKTKIFPLVLIILQAGAGIVKIGQRDWGSVIYWLAAAVLNTAVAFLM